MRYEVQQDLKPQEWIEPVAPFGGACEAEALGLNIRISALAARPKVAFATKASHCLVDVLQRWRGRASLSMLVSLRIIRKWGIRRVAQVPFHHVDFAHQPKVWPERWTLLDEHQVDLTVLARFMQSFPPT